MAFLDIFSQRALGSGGAEGLGALQQGARQSLRELMQRQQQQHSALEAAALWQSFIGIPDGELLKRATNVKTRNPKSTLALIKKSIKKIKAEAVSEEAQGRVRAKIDRLLDLGALTQATILNTELRLRAKLARVQEWDYKVLPFEAIQEYVKVNQNWDGRGGYYKVHIDLLEDYCGAETSEEAKDKIIPDDVLDELETAKDRQIFDKFSVLRVEKVPDPLLLGSIDGCKDYFFICEWGEDISFDQIMKNGG